MVYQSQKSVTESQKTTSTTMSGAGVPFYNGNNNVDGQNGNNSNDNNHNNDSNNTSNSIISNDHIKQNRHVDSNAIARNISAKWSSS